MTDKVYFVAGQPDDWAVICESLADAQNELFLRGCEDEFVYVADGMEVDVDSLAASVSMVLVDMSTTTGAFINVDNFDSFEDFREEVYYQLSEATDFYGLDAHAYALFNVERYRAVMSLARC